MFLSTIFLQVQIENSNYGNDITSIIAEVEKHEIEFEKIKQVVGKLERSEPLFCKSRYHNLFLVNT